VDPFPEPLLCRKSGSAGNGTQDLWVSSQELWPLDHRSGLHCTKTTELVWCWQNRQFLRWETYLPRSCTAFSQSLFSMALVTAFVLSTHSIRGNRTAWFPSSETTQDSVSGVASMSAITASAPIRHPYQTYTLHNYQIFGQYTHWRMGSSGMLRRVALVRTELSEELSTLIIRVTRIGELGTTYVGC
jgi:hypothetical protein